MKTCHWGRKYWTVFYHMILEYLNNAPYGHNVEAYHLQLFFEELQYILPCRSCKKHYRQNLQKLPVVPFLTNRNSMIVWLIKMQNQVNLMLNKSVLNEDEFHAKFYKPVTCSTHLNCNCDQVENVNRNSTNNQSVQSYTINDAIWSVLFSIALTYPESPKIEEEFHYRLFITEFLYLMPESKMKKLIWITFNQSGITLDQAVRKGRMGLYKFIYQLHNTVMLKQNCLVKYTDKLIMEKYLCKI